MLLTIGILAYGRDLLYEKLLKSVIIDSGQYLNKEVELIISNDASLGRVDEITTEIHKKNPCFQYFLQEKNLGPILNSYFIIRKSTGKYIWLLGNDDVIRPGTVYRILNYIKKYQNHNLGGVFLAAIPGEYLSSTNPIDWNEAETLIRGPRKEILETYDPNSVGNLIFHPDQNLEWMFVSKCILLRNAYLEILEDQTYQKLWAHPLPESLYSVRGKSFIQDHMASIVAKLSDHTHWDKKHHYIYTVDLLRCILELRRFGFTEQEVRRMVNSLFLTGRYYLELRHCFRPSCWASGRSLLNWLEMMRLIIKNGYSGIMLSVLHGRNKRALKRLKSRVSKIFIQKRCVSCGKKTNK